MFCKSFIYLDVHDFCMYLIMLMFVIGLYVFVLYLYNIVSTKQMSIHDIKGIDKFPFQFNINFLKVFNCPSPRKKKLCQNHQISFGHLLVDFQSTEALYTPPLSLFVATPPPPPPPLSTHALLKSYRLYTWPVRYFIIVQQKRYS